MFSLENKYLLNPKSLNELLFLQANRPQIPPHLSALILQNRMLPYLAKRPLDQNLPSNLYPITKKTKTEKVEVLISNPDLKNYQTESPNLTTHPVERIESSSSLKAVHFTQPIQNELKPSSKKLSMASVKSEPKLESVPIKKNPEAEVKIETQEKEKPKKELAKDPKVAKQQEEREIYELMEKYNAVMSGMKTVGKTKKKDNRKNKKRLKKIEDDESTDEFSLNETEDSKESE